MKYSFHLTFHPGNGFIPLFKILEGNVSDFRNAFNQFFHIQGDCVIVC